VGLVWGKGQSHPTLRLQVLEHSRALNLCTSSAAATASASSLASHHNSNRPTSDMASYRLRFRVEQIEIRSTGNWAGGGVEMFCSLTSCHATTVPNQGSHDGGGPGQMCPSQMSIGRTTRPTPRDWPVMHACRLPCPSLPSVWDPQTAAKLPSSSRASTARCCPQPASSSTVCSLAQRRGREGSWGKYGRGIIGTKPSASEPPYSEPEFH
jgi:hypothetical protein